MNESLTFFTCSIFPDVTRIWYHILSQAIDPNKFKVVIYDSSGLLEKDLFSAVKIIRHPNVEHGKKIDHFISNNLETKYFFLLDDDAFLTSYEAVDFGYSWLNKEVKNAIISYKPRPWWRLNINGQEHIPMGSYALMIKAALVTSNKLSFSGRRTDRKEIRNGSGYYDTGDYINEFLLQNGCEITLAPDALMDNIPTFFGTSSGLLTFYKKTWFSQRLKRKSLEDIERLILADTYNLQRAMSIIFVVSIFRRLFNEQPCYNDFISLQDLERIVLNSKKEEFISSYHFSLNRHQAVEKMILNKS